jgi:LAGLIDADG DNA endonuclease family
LVNSSIFGLIKSKKQSLAFWAQDDGSSTTEGFYLNNHSFSFREQLILQQALFIKKINFGLICNIHKHESQYKLYIRAKSLPQFRSLVLPYFTPSMLYKLYPTKKIN